MEDQEEDNDIFQPLEAFKKTVAEVCQMKKKTSSRATMSSSGGSLYSSGRSSDTNSSRLSASQEPDYENFNFMPNLSNLRTLVASKYMKVKSFYFIILKIFFFMLRVKTQNVINMLNA